MLKLKGEEETPQVQPKFQNEPEVLNQRDEFEDTYVSPALKTAGKEQFAGNNATMSGSPVHEPEKKDNPLLSAAFLIAFVAWIGGMVYFSKTEPRLCISTFGAFWLLIAVVCVAGFIKNGIQDLRNVIIAFVFVFLGVGLTFVPILQLYVPMFQGEFGFRMAMYLVFIFCIVVGALLIGVEAYRILHNRVVCTVEVQAECLKLRDKHFWRDEVSVEEAQGYLRVTSGGIAYRRKAVHGVYRFDYKGQTYEVEDDTNSNMNVPTPGGMYTLHINPKNPNEFCRQMGMTHMGIFIIGISFLLIGILCCVVF